MSEYSDYLLPFVDYYGAMGIATFPIHAGTKVPAKGSHGHNDATTDPNVFRALLQRFESHQRIGLAARMGDQLLNGAGYLVCLDIDEKKGRSGSATLRNRRFELEPTLTATTRSNGRHLLYYSPNPLQTKTNWLGSKERESGLDLKASRSWIAVAPTWGYEWTEEPTLPSIAAAPFWLLNRSQRGSGGQSDNSLVQSRELVCCPVHDDSTPSLQVTALKSGGKLYHCFGGCSFAELVAAGVTAEADAEALAWAQSLQDGGQR